MYNLNQNIKHSCRFIATYVSNFHPLEVVGRCIEPQLQVGENINLECKALRAKRSSFRFQIVFEEQTASLKTTRPTISTVRVLSYLS